jgi:hypothetical protein
MKQPNVKRRFSKRRLLKQLGKRVFRGTDAWFGRTSEIPDAPVLTREHVPWLADLERAAPTIRAELDALLEARALLPRFQDIAANQQRIADDDQWRIFALWGFGRCSELGRRTCPETTACLDGIAGLESAFFSILGPGKHIPRPSSRGSATSPTASRDRAQRRGGLRRRQRTSARSRSTPSSITQGDCRASGSQPSKVRMSRAIHPGLLRLKTRDSPRTSSTTPDRG